MQSSAYCTERQQINPADRRTCFLPPFSGPNQMVQTLKLPRCPGAGVAIVSRGDSPARSLVAVTDYQSVKRCCWDL